MVNKLVSVHIPKTGGKTFLLGILVKAFRGQVHHDKKDIPYTGKFRYANNESYRKYNYIHGHFQAKKYFHLWPEYQFITILRQPVDRIISQYYFQKVMKPTKEDTQLNRLFHENLSLIDFAEMKSNYMTKIYLNDKPLEFWKWIGFQEYYQQSIDNFNRVFDLKPKVGGFHVYNVSDNEEYLKRQIDDKTKKTIAEFNKIDIEFYNQAVKKWIR